MAAVWWAVLVLLAPRCWVRARVTEMRVSGSTWARGHSQGHSPGPHAQQGRLTLADWNAYDERDNNGPGTYSFGYDIEDPASGNTQFRQEERHANGTVTGSYGLVEPDGNVRVVTYIADHLGYRVKMENSLHDSENYPRTRTEPRKGGRPGQRPGWATKRAGNDRKKPPRVETEWLDTASRSSPPAPGEPRDTSPSSERAPTETLVLSGEELQQLKQLETSSSAPAPAAALVLSGSGDQLQLDEEVYASTSSSELPPAPSASPKRRKHYRARTRVRVAPAGWRLYPVPMVVTAPASHHFQLPPAPLLDHLVHNHLPR